jgi:hypothetical protein
MLHWVIDDEAPRYAFRDLFTPQRPGLLDMIFLQARRTPKASAMANEGQ